MFAITGAILLNAACILLVHETSENNLFPFRLLLIAVGSGFIGWELSMRWLAFKRSGAAQIGDGLVQ
jgi:hypothetical protein